MLPRDFAEIAKRPGWEIEAVKRSDGRSVFVVLPKRWIVERTFGWLGDRCCPPRNGYERNVSSGIAMTQIAMTTLVLHRLQPG